MLTAPSIPPATAPSMSPPTRSCGATARTFLQGLTIGIPRSLARASFLLALYFDFLIGSIARYPLSAQQTQEQQFLGYM
jgi:hypothetical protein